jgi:hypothetical protein
VCRRKKAYYFEDGMYYHGGMGRLVKAVKVLAKITRKVSQPPPSLLH